MTEQQMNKLVCLMASALLSGCAVYHAQPIQPAALMQSFEARTLDNPDLLRYIAAHLPDDVSNRSPGSWDINTLSLAAFYFSPELDVARAQAAVSQATVETAGQRPNPSIQLPLQYTTNAKPGESPYTFGLGLDIPIETAGKRGYRIAQAQQLSNAARFRVGGVAWRLRSALRSQLLDLHAATGKAEILEQQINAQGQIVAMLDKRLSVGAASASEANQAHIALTQNQISLADVNKQIEDQRAQIAATIGVPVSALAHTPISFDAFKRVYPDIPTDDARREAILNRADLLAALSEYEASQVALQLEVARQVPDIHLGPGYEFDAGAHKFMLPVSGISLPIFNRNEGPIAEAVARRKEIAARVNAAQAQAIDEIDRAIQNYHGALKNLHLAESLLTGQERQWRDAQKTFNAGETDRLTLTFAQYAFYASALARQEARVQVQREIGRLEDAMQRPLSATDIQAIPE